MSPLTRIFVVLLIVTSLLLSAASLTFLYTTPDYAGQVETLEAQVAAGQSAVARAQSEGNSAASAARAELETVQAALAEARARTTQLQGEIAAAQAEVAQAELENSQVQAANTVAMTAVTQSQATTQQLREQLASLRDTYEQTVDRQAETSSKLAETQNLLAYASRALRTEQERNVELLSQNDTAKRLLADAGIDLGDFDPQRASAISPPPINGVIEATEVLDGVKYATVSVGTEDDVVRGMQFIVLDGRSGDFLGFVNIEDVDDQTAFGRLEGNRLPEIDADDLVRTQLVGS